MPNIEDAWQNQGGDPAPVLASLLSRRAKDSELSLRLQYGFGLVLMAGAGWAFLFHYIHTRDFWLGFGTLLAVIGVIAFLVAAPWLSPSGATTLSRRLLYWLGLALLAAVVWLFLLRYIRSFHFWLGIGIVMAGIGAAAVLVVTSWLGPARSAPLDLGLTTSAEFYRQRLRNRGTWRSRFIRAAVVSMAPGYLFMLGASIGVSRDVVRWLHLFPFMALFTAGLAAHALVWLRERRFVRREIELIDAITRSADLRSS